LKYLLKISLYLVTAFHPLTPLSEIANNQNSLRDAAQPTLLEDFVLRENITHFDHERIMHARGSAAHGCFELTRSLRMYTTAKLLTGTGEKAPVFARFSTVAGGAGSVDTPRDVRGLVVKFYTKQDNWDLVGNSIPTLFIQDAIKFPDLQGPACPRWFRCDGGARGRGLSIRFLPIVPSRATAQPSRRDISGIDPRRTPAGLVP